MIRFECDCGAKLKVNDDQQGNQFDCPKCGQLITVPSTAAATESPDEPSEPSLPPLPAKRPQRIVKPEKEEQPVSVLQALTKKRSGYLACRVLQFVLRWGTLLCIPYVLLAACLLFIVDNPVVFMGLIYTIIAATGAVFINLAIAELLGGIVAFLVKNDCYP